MFGWKITRASSPESLACPATAYRLRGWPELPDRARTASVYRALSRMCQGAPVTLSWFMAQTRLGPRAADDLFNFMVGNGQLEIIDLSRFQNGPAVAH